MAQLGEAIARYHHLLEREPFRDLAWVDDLQTRIRALGLGASGRLLAPVLRPHFVSRRQLDTLSRASGRLSAILDNVETLALDTPALLNRLRLLPAEKTLAGIPCGPSRLNVASQMDAAMQNGTLCLRRLEACRPAGLGYSERLADLFLRLPIVQEFQRDYCKLTKLGGSRHLLAALLRAWQAFGGQHSPNIAIVELGPKPGASPETSESRLLAESFTAAGHRTQVVSPDALEYRAGKLCAGDFEIHVVLRRIVARELLTRSDFNHPLLRAYRDHTVCFVNDFRSEIAQCRALFDLVTDESVTARLPSADRQLVRDFVPWTRLLAPRKTIYKDQEIDLPGFVARSRARFVLWPNDDHTPQAVYVGAEMTQASWERAVHNALSASYVVQERVAPMRAVFPLSPYGALEWKEAEVVVHPHMLNGKMQGAVAALESCSGVGHLPLSIAPVLVLEQLALEQNVMEPHASPA